MTGAIQYWSRLLGDFPNVEEERMTSYYWLTEGFSFEKAGPPESEGIPRPFERGSRVIPEGAERAGWFHFQKGNWKEASHHFLALLQEASGVKPGLPLPLRSWWGQCYLNQGDYRRARILPGACLLPSRKARETKGEGPVSTGVDCLPGGKIR